MNTYFEFLPRELLYVPLDYIKDYYNIIDYTKVVKINNEESKNIFFRTYPLIYNDIKNISYDDLYLNNDYNKVSNWIILYATFNRLNNIKNLSLEYIINMQVHNSNILYRAACNKIYPDIYIYKNKKY